MLIKFLKNVNLDGQTYTTLTGEKSVTAEVGAALIATGDAVEVTDYLGYNSATGAYVGVGGPIAVVSWLFTTAMLAPSSSWQALGLATSEFESKPNLLVIDDVTTLSFWLDLTAAAALGATHLKISGSIAVNGASLTGTRGIRAVGDVGQTLGSCKVPPLLATGIQGLSYNTRLMPLSYITDGSTKVKFEVYQDSAATLTFASDTPLSRMSCEFWKL